MTLDANPYSAPQSRNEREPGQLHMFVVFISGLILSTAMLLYFIYFGGWQWLASSIGIALVVAIVCSELDDRWIKKHSEWMQDHH